MIEYDKDAIVPPYITEYLRGETPPHHGILKELEEYASEHEVPIIQPETAQFLKVIGSIIRPHDILEVGAAIGYSSILMADTLADGGKIVTMEYDGDMARIARENIRRAGLYDTITLAEGDAKDLMPNIGGQYDMIFLDGPKAHYIYMLNDCLRLLRPGGVLIADNVLYKGMTADDGHVIRRKITIVKRLRHFVSALYARSELTTSVLPLGDGITISVKNKEKV